MIAGGASIVQLRKKNASAREVYAAAEETLRLSREHGVRLIINDRVDIAMLLGADGVHLGQNDLSPVHARRLLGEQAIIGYSTHTIEQAAAAVKLPIDYIAFGPIFPTQSKANPDPVVGLSILPEIKAIAHDLPLVAIGGIDEANILQVLEAGANSAAVIGSVHSDPRGIAVKLQSLLQIKSELGG